MPRTLYITKGEYAGRYMRLEDDQADQALSDGWAQENEPNEEDKLKAAEKLDKGELPEEEEDPDSLTEFENPPDPGAEEEGSDDKPRPVRRVAKPQRRSRS